MELKDLFKIDLHGTNELKGNVIRYNGYIRTFNDDDTETIIFDNGNTYLLKDDEILKRIAGDDVFFIDRHIAKSIYNAIESNPIFTNNYEYRVNGNYNEITFYRTLKSDVSDSALLIRLIINRESQTISISNILIPNDLKFNSFGKKIIKEIYTTSKKYNYQVYLVQMVESFYNQMVERNAKIIDPLDIVEITDQTIL